MAFRMAVTRAVDMGTTIAQPSELPELVLISKPYSLRKYHDINRNKVNLFVELGNHQRTKRVTFTAHNPDVTREPREKQKWDSRGKEAHAQMIKNGIEQNSFYGTKLITRYAKCGSLVDARLLFDKMHKPNLFTWTAMITGHASYGFYEEALALFYQMQGSGIGPDTFIFNSVLKACAGLESLQLGEKIHALIIRSGFESDVFAGSSLVYMYAKCQRIECARQVFDKMSQRSVVSWNVTIAGYGQNGRGGEALKLFRQMQREGMKPCLVTVIIVLPICANLGALQQGKEVHSYIIRSGSESDVFVGSAVVDMYVKCKSMENARQVFEKMPERNVVSWNAMIAGYAQQGQAEEALKLFSQMQLEDVEPDQITWTAIVAGYARNGCGDEARKLFQQMHLSGVKPDVISWNAIIAAYAQNEHWDEALKFFRQMQMANLKPNSATIASVLPACANLAALQQGKEIHDYIIRRGFYSDVFAGSALLDMYAKCGSIEDARNVFDKMSQRNVVSWNAMIVGYAMHGQAEHALSLFHQMQRECMKPNHITFTGVLSACSHAGLLEEGWQYFNRMSQDYCITPSVEHYACMVDLLGRAGYLDEAHDLITKMSLEPNACVWGALLAACRIHCNIGLGKRVAEHLFQLEPESTGSYVLLSNIHAAAGRWDEVVKVRKMMKDRGLKKSPGHSWIEIKNRVHVFLVADTSHPETEKIYAMLECLARRMKAAGYVPDTKFVLDDV